MFQHLDLIVRKVKKTMAGFNNKYKLSNNYITACRSKNKLRVYEYKDGTYAFINGVKTPVKNGMVINGKTLNDNGEYHHSKTKYGYSKVMFWEFKD